MLTFADLLLTQEVTEATGEQPSTGTEREARRAGKGELLLGSRAQTPAPL